LFGLVKKDANLLHKNLTNAEKPDDLEKLLHKKRCVRRQVVQISIQPPSSEKMMRRFFFTWGEASAFLMLLFAEDLCKPASSSEKLDKSRRLCIPANMAELIKPDANGKTRRLFSSSAFSRKKFPHIFLRKSSLTRKCPTLQVFDPERLCKAPL
jgi:hypothetical protein